MPSHDTQQYAARTTTALPQPLLSVDDAAAFLRVSRRQVYRLVERGELKPLRVGSRLRFRLRDLESAP